MPKFAANLSMMFNEHAFLDRFKAAADAGFTAVEYLFPYEVSPEAIAKALADNGLTQALFNLPPGDWASGERGLASLPERFEEFAAGVETALTYAQASGVKQLHMMAGLSDKSDPKALLAYERAVRHGAERLATKGLHLLLEPINPRDMPGYFLNDFNWCAAFIARLGLPNVALQYDIYHRQIIHGDVTKGLEAMLPITRHIQIASVPARHEPDTGELNDTRLFETLDAMGYDGFIGCEYRPKGETVAGLGWFAKYKGAAR
ncbi:MAG: hydroxypyruvate isomerase family protein [Proteobacteria bacterium]|nr:hydroxypyruvate isomerase family protein [Pseudomonadota bacterium]